MSNITVVAIPEPRAVKEARIIAEEERIRRRQERIKQVRREALHNIFIIIYTFFATLPSRVIAFLPTVPDRLYRATLDVIARTIILLLFIGVLLFAFCFFTVAVMWFSQFIPWPA